VFLSNPGVASSTPDANDLFYLELKYDQPESVLGGTATKNGNISHAIWRVRGRERQSYAMTYDYLDRMLSATYRNLNDAGTAVNNTDAWNESLTYDVRGNILSLARNGKYKTTPTATCWTDGQTDNLAYTYYPGYNRLQKIADSAPAASKAEGWNNPANASSAAVYGYDANGNMNADPYKGMNITYNHLNLPTLITFAGGTKKIELLYSGNGAKLRKTVTDNNVLQYRQDYNGGLEYRSTGAVPLSLESMAHAEGRVYNTNVGTSSADALRYEYAIRDHLGNTRLMFTDKNNNGLVEVSSGSSNELLQETHYYPFGMELNGPWSNDAAALDNPYKYNGKELNADFGLGWYDYGARWYDAAVGRWWSVDPLVEKYLSWSGYNYTMNNPVKYIDPDGMDIVLGITQRDGETTEKFQERRYATLDQLQKLTNDKLALDGNKVIIAKAGDGKKDAGTQLVRNLIDGVQTEDGTIKNYTITIVDNKGNINGTEPVNSNGVSTDDAKEKSSNGVGTGSEVNFLINKSGNGSVNADGTTGRPAHIGLAHELIHADHNMRGNNTNKTDTTVNDPDDATGRRTLKQEEVNTRKQENIIRREQGVISRKLEHKR